MESKADHRVYMRPDAQGTAFPWHDYIRRFESGTWRAPIFRDMVASDIKARGPSPVVLDIGCGRGFDDSIEMQASLAALAGTYIGVEPDTSVTPPASCHCFHATTLEKAAIRSGSVDVAFATFVLEHLGEPEPFFAAVKSVLAPGGVFWATTIDARSPFAFASTAMKVLGVKDRYLDRMFGARQERHLNYPTVYGANTPRRLQALSKDFQTCEVASLHCVGIVDKLLPDVLHSSAHALDRATLKFGWPGTNLVLRNVR